MAATVRQRYHCPVKFRFELFDRNKCVFFGFQRVYWSTASSKVRNRVVFHQLHACWACQSHLVINPTICETLSVCIQLVPDLSVTGCSTCFVRIPTHSIISGSQPGL